MNGNNRQPRVPTLKDLYGAEQSSLPWEEQQAEIVRFWTDSDPLDGRLVTTVMRQKDVEICHGCSLLKESGPFTPFIGLEPSNFTAKSGSWPGVKLTASHVFACGCSRRGKGRSPA